MTTMPPTHPHPPATLTAARPFTPDDLRPGDGVTVAHVTAQILACEDPPPGDDENRVLRAKLIPESAGYPLRIKQVCLPFVLVKSPTGDHATLDLRRHHLLRLDDAYTRAAFKALDPKRKERKRDRKKKR